MATRKPLVRIGGKNQQLPAADSIDVPGARFHEGATEPTIKDYGDRWLDTSSGIKYTWVDPGVWVDLSEPTSADIAAAIHAATSKTTPVDADELGYLDSTSSFGLVRMTWANLKTWLGGLFVSKAGDTMTGNLHVETEGETGLELGLTGYGSGPILHGYVANGTKASPTAITSGQMLLGIGARGWDGVGFAEHSTSAIHMVSTENHSSTEQGSDFRILFTPNGSTHEDRIVAVRYHSDALGHRAEMPLGGAESARMRFQSNVAGHNSSITVVPYGDALASNLQARDSNGAVAHRAYLESNAAIGARLVSDTIGGGTAHNLTVVVGSTTGITLVEAGTVTHHAGTKLGADAPILRVKKITGTTGATEGATTVVAHGLDSSLIRGIQVIVQYPGGSLEAIPPGVSLSAGKQYEAYCGGTNLAITNHATNSENILSRAFTALITYEPTA